MSSLSSSAPIEAPKFGYNPRSHVFRRSQMAQQHIKNNTNPYRNNKGNNMNNHFDRRGKRNGFYGATPTAIPTNLAIIYPQDNLLWSYFKNKAKIIDQNAWLPIVSLWKQDAPNIIYMLRGQNKGSLSLSLSSPNKRRKRKKVRSQSVEHHLRTYNDSAPIPSLSPREIMSNKSPHKISSHSFYYGPKRTTSPSTSPKTIKSIKPFKRPSRDRTRPKKSKSKSPPTTTRSNKRP
eukprot:131671_1